MTRAVALTVILICLAVPAAAQTVSATTGAINGIVKDKTQGVLPGVTVTISGPALMGTRETVTSGEGEYRFVAVPPGEYKVVFELVGFATVVREGIVVGIGFTATVNVELELAAQQETITVTGASPVVDTQATKITTTYIAAQMANIPNARDLASLMVATPAVKADFIDVGGSAALSTNFYTVYGTRGQIRPMVEGILATEGTGSTFYIDYGSFAEVAVSTAALSAETGTPGVFTQMVTKSGGNTYRATVYLDYEHKKFGTRNIDDAQIARGVTGGTALDPRDINRVTKFRDFNVDTGGFIVKDKLWWFASFRNVVNHIAKVQYPVKPQELKVLNRTAKLTYALTQNNKFIAFINHNNKVLPDDFSGYYRDRTVTIQTSSSVPWDERFPAGVWKGEYNSVLSDAAFFEVRAGGYFYNWHREAKRPLTPRYEDIATNEAFGSPADIELIRLRPQVLGSLSYYKDGWGGDHNFKFGGEYMHETADNNEGALPDAVLHLLRNGVPTEVRLYEMPSRSVSGLDTTSAYVTDTWRPTGRLTVNLGFRFDRYRNWLPEQIHPVSRFNPTEDTFAAVDKLAVFNTFGPRAGLSYDLSGNGRTVLKMNFAGYADSPSASLWNPNPTQWWRNYTWTDLNGDRLWQPGEEGRLTASRGGATNEAIDPNLVMGWTREWAGWLERELVANWGVRTGFVWRERGNPSVTRDVNRPYDAFDVPISIPDPGPDGRVGTSDDGTPIAGFNLNPAYLGRTPFNLRTFLPGERNQSDFYSWEITANRRMNRRWSLVTTFAKTWSRESVNALNPNTLINSKDDQRSHYTNWQGKVHGTLELPGDFRVSPLIRAQSGLPYGRQFSYSFNYGAQTILAEPYGSIRLDTLVLVDLRMEKAFPVKGRRVGVFLDVFNMFNTNPTTSIVATSGSSFMRPVTITSPRIAKVGLKFDW
ncbi:MAG: TonB-dependent receptor [Acidobacteria bacterium]|nr:TonB-dependent receptor [Acidobacteriota bacterium]